jgi:integrase
MKKLKYALGFPESKKLTPHVFRHTGATHLRQNGMDISELQDILSHANPNTTRIYAKNDLTNLKKSYDKYHRYLKLDHSYSHRFLKPNKGHAYNGRRLLTLIG